MKQVKQIIEFILVLASCFFRSKKQQKGNYYLPEDPYPPGTCNGRKGDCPGCTGCNCNPQSAPATGQSDQEHQPIGIGNEGADGTTPATGAANLLGWCLIAVAGTSYLYKLLV